MRGRFGDAIVQRDHARHLLASCPWGRRNAGLDDLEQGEVDVAPGPMGRSMPGHVPPGDGKR